MIDVSSRLCDYLFLECGLFSRITPGGLPLGAGISFQLSGGRDKAEYLDGGTLKTVAALILVKHPWHKTAAETALAIENAVRRLSGSERPFGAERISVSGAAAFVSGNVTEFVYSVALNIVVFCD